MTPLQVARSLNVTRQNIYTAIKKNKLKAFKLDNRYFCTTYQILEYQNNKHSREHFYNIGHMSVNACAIKLGCKPQRVYYLIRRGKIKCIKKDGLFHIVKKDFDVEGLKNLRVYVKKKKYDSA